MKLAADASALVAEVLRRRGAWLITQSDLDLYIADATWSEAAHELARRLDSMVQQGRFGPTEREALYSGRLALLNRHVTLLSQDAYGQFEVEARDRIPQDQNDWPTVAVALALDSGIWTNDRDFFGCGVPVWTTDTLLTHVETGRVCLIP